MEKSGDSTTTEELIDALNEAIKDRHKNKKDADDTEHINLEELFGED